MTEQLDLFDAGNGGDQSAQSTPVRQFAVTRRKLASEPGVSQFASSPTPSIWRGGNGEHTPPSPAGIKPTQFADSEQWAEAVDLVIANLGGVVLGQQAQPGVKKLSTREVGGVVLGQTLCILSTRSVQATPEQNTAYRTGRCIDCRTVRYSAGRPRCNGCHDALAHRVRPAAPGRTNQHTEGLYNIQAQAPTGTSA